MLISLFCLALATLDKCQHSREPRIEQAAAVAWKFASGPSDNSVEHRY
jgi:hypothetical protein